MTRPAPRSPLDILVVEDAVFHQRLATNLLRPQGHRVTVAENGQQALDLLKSRQFDLVLMDVEMPIMDGLTATSEIRRREHERGGHTAIVAVTSTRDATACLAAGMDAYLAKPLRHDVLTQTMTEVLDQPSA